MDIHLDLGRTDGVFYDFTELTDSPDYDLLVVKGPKEMIEFAINALTPVYGLIAREATALPNSNSYEKLVFVPKHEFQGLKEAVFGLFNQAQGNTNN